MTLRIITRTRYGDVMVQDEQFRQTLEQMSEAGLRNLADWIEVRRRALKK
jgi:hypothetical protein